MVFSACVWVAVMNDLENGRCVFSYEGLGTQALFHVKFWRRNDAKPDDVPTRRDQIVMCPLRSGRMSSRGGNFVAKNCRGRKERSSAGHMRTSSCCHFNLTIRSQALFNNRTLDALTIWESVFDIAVTTAKFVVFRRDALPRKKDTYWLFRHDYHNY